MPTVELDHLRQYSFNQLVAFIVLICQHLSVTYEIHTPAVHPINTLSRVFSTPLRCLSSDIIHFWFLPWNIGWHYIGILHCIFSLMLNGPMILQGYLLHSHQSTDHWWTTDDVASLHDEGVCLHWLDECPSCKPF